MICWIPGLKVSCFTHCVSIHFITLVECRSQDFRFVYFLSFRLAKHSRTLCVDREKCLWLFFVWESRNENNPGVCSKSNFIYDCFFPLKIHCSNAASQKIRNISHFRFIRCKSLKTKCLWILSGQFLCTFHIPDKLNNVNQRSASYNVLCRLTVEWSYENVVTNKIPYRFLFEIAYMTEKIITDW